MLWSEVDCVVSNLAVCDALSILLGRLWGNVDLVGLLGPRLLSEVLVDGNKASSLICLGSPRRNGLERACRRWNGELCWGAGAQGEACGALASEPV